MPSALIVCPNTTLEITYLINSLSLEEQSTAKSRHWTASGKGVNVARVLTQLNADCTVVGCSGGFIGELVKSQLNQEEVDFDFIDTLIETRCSLVIKHKSGQKIIREQGFENSLEAEPQLLSLVKRYIRNTPFVCLCGSLPRNVSDVFFRNIAIMCKKAGAKVFIDSSNQPLLKSLSAKPFLIKPNLAEAQDLLGCEINTLQEKVSALKMLRHLGAQNIVITLGQNGAIALIGDKLYNVDHAPSEKTTNPVGAGDSMMAGLIMGYLNNFSPKETLLTATAMAISSTHFPYSGIVDPLKYKRFYGDIRINERRIND